MEWTLTVDSGSSSSSVSEREQEPDDLTDKAKLTKIKSGVTWGSAPSYVVSEPVGPASPDTKEDIKTNIPTKFDTSFMPFTLRWSYGRNIDVPFINLTTDKRGLIFYASSHVAVLYDFKEKKMKLLQGHKNQIISISSDKEGMWLVTADMGKDNIIIVWNSENFLPVRTIFNPHPEEAIRLVKISPDATYLIVISDQTLSCWHWTTGSVEASGTHPISKKKYGKIKHVAFCTERNDHFALTAGKHMIFGTWENDKLDIHICDTIKSGGYCTQSLYISMSHYVVTATSTGNALLWSEVPYGSVYDCNIPLGNKKKLTKNLKLDSEPITVITSFKDVIVTGNASGEVRFYDRMLKILYWVQSFELKSISALEFHKAYRDDDEYMSEMGEAEDESHTKIQKILNRLRKHKYQQSDANKAVKIAMDKVFTMVKEDDKRTYDDIVNHILEEVEKRNISPNDKRQFVENIADVALQDMKDKVSETVWNTKNIVTDVVDSVFKELDKEESAKEDAKQFTQDIIDEILQTFDDQSLKDPNSIKMMARNVVAEILKKIEDETIPQNDSRSVADNVVKSILMQTERRASDVTSLSEKVAQYVVSSLMENMKEIPTEVSREGSTSGQESTHEIDERFIPHRPFTGLKKFKLGDAKSLEQHAPSDATLQRQPFVVGDFMTSTSDGEIGFVDFIKNVYTVIVDKSESPVTAIDCHNEKQHFVIGNAAGSVIMYSFLVTRIRLFDNRVAPDDEDVSVTALKFAPSGFYLACGLADGSFRILDSSLLTPVANLPEKNVNKPITQICISDDSQWIAHKDEGERICLYKCNNPNGTDIEFMGKQKSHYKPISDMMFTRTSEEELRLLTLGEDRVLVEYDLEHSQPGCLAVLSMERIEQSAIPYSMAMYPNYDVESFIVISNSEYKFKILNSTSKMCRKTALGPRFRKPVLKMQILPAEKDDPTKLYMIFACDKEIGIQKLPLDGNPFKSIAMIGHPQKLTHMVAYTRTKTLFTAGKNDTAVLMWSINTRAVNIMQRIGGEGLDPYFCLVEGGQSGILFKEIQNFFYYAQILHQGESTPSERQVSDKIPLCEVPDLMRAIGYYPSEYEIENMLHEVHYSTFSETGHQEKFIGFEDFIKLYINHQPAFGVPFRRLKQAFDTFADINPEESIMSRDSLVGLLQERGECFSLDQVRKYLQVLIPSEAEPESPVYSGDRKSSDESFNFVPDEISYTTFAEEILGLTMDDAKGAKLQEEGSTEEEQEEEEEDVEEEEESEEYASDEDIKAFKEQAREKDKEEEEQRLIYGFDD